MKVSYTLSIDSIEKLPSVNGFNDLIINVGFTVSTRSDALTTTDERGNTIESVPSFEYSKTLFKEFDYKQINEETFIPFEQVTKDVIISWLLAQEGVDSIEKLSYVVDTIKSIYMQIKNYVSHVPKEVSGDEIPGSPPSGDIEFDPEQDELPLYTQEYSPNGARLF